MIRIKTDDTISNSNALSIVPDDGDTGVLIDGETVVRNDAVVRRRNVFGAQRRLVGDSEKR
jgi:hypothetical protein